MLTSRWGRDRESVLLFLAAASFSIKRPEPDSPSPHSSQTMWGRECLQGNFQPEGTLDLFLLSQEPCSGMEPRLSEVLLSQGLKHHSLPSWPVQQHLSRGLAGMCVSHLQIGILWAGGLGLSCTDVWVPPLIPQVISYLVYGHSLRNCHHHNLSDSSVQLLPPVVIIQAYLLSTNNCSGSTVSFQTFPSDSCCLLCKLAHSII